MPREGTGRSDNAVEAGHNIIHGAGEEKPSSHVDRANKAAPMPEHEKGAGLQEPLGGQSQGLSSGPDRGQGGRGRQH